MKHTPFIIAFLLLLGSCRLDPSLPDPQLLTVADRTVIPNTTIFVTDGQLVSGIYFVVDSGYGYPRMGVDHVRRRQRALNANPLTDLYIDPSPIVTLGNFTRIYTDDAINGGREVRLDMDAVGQARWLVATGRSIGEQVAIVVGDSVVSAPIVQDGIPNGRAAIHMGNVPDSEVEAFALQLNVEKKGTAPVR